MHREIAVGPQASRARSEALNPLRGNPPWVNEFFKAED